MLPIFSPFGVPRGDHMHQGVDIPMPVGTVVVASVGGLVTRLDVDGVGKGKVHGNAVHILGRDGRRWIYMHLSVVRVQVNQIVAQGQAIGATGNTGNSKGPHLHLQVMVGAIAIDPVPLFPRGTFKGVA